MFFNFFSSRRRHTRYWRDWSSDVCSSDLGYPQVGAAWVNTGALLARWNAAFALAERRVKGVTVDLHSLTPAGSPTAGAMVEIGRASCRGRVEISGVAGSLKKNNIKICATT